MSRQPQFGSASNARGGRPAQTLGLLLVVLLCVGGCETAARYFITNPPDITVCKETCDCIKHLGCHDKCNPGCHREEKETPSDSIP